VSLDSILSLKKILARLYLFPIAMSKSAKSEYMSEPYSAGSSSRPSGRSSRGVFKIEQLLNRC
jgi:hypothetical protein